jgi:hypothetical protein
MCKLEDPSENVAEEEDYEKAWSADLGQVVADTSIRGEGLMKVGILTGIISCPLTHNWSFLIVSCICSPDLYPAALSVA